MDDYRQYLHQQYSIGVLIKASARLWLANAGFYTTMALVVTAPHLLAVMLFPFDAASDAVLDLTIANLAINWVLPLICSILLTAVFCVAATLQIRARPVYFGREWIQEKTLIFPVIFVGVVTTLIIYTCFVLLIIPGFIAAVMLALVIPSVVNERMGLLDSIRRSRELTKGRRWTIFFALLLPTLPFMVGTALVGDLELYLFSLGAELRTLLVLEYAGTLAIDMVWSMFIAYTYHHLKVEKEGQDEDDLAMVFQ